MKRQYKKILNPVLLLLVTFFVASCGSDGDSLSASEAKEVINKEIDRLHCNQRYEKIVTGYFECNDDSERFFYRKLAANDVITYKCDKIKRIERIRKSRQVLRGYYFTYYDTEYYYVNDTVDTYFVTIALTEKGKAYMIDSLPEPNPTDDEEEVMMVNKQLEEQSQLLQYPESMVSFEEFPEEKKADESITVSKGSDTKAYLNYDQQDSRTNNKKQSEYELAKLKENTSLVYVKLYGINVVKVRNIAVSVMGVPTAKAEVVYEEKDVTPFGRIISQAIEKKRHVFEVNFVYYQDKGWVVKEMI